MSLDDNRFFEAGHEDHSGRLEGVMSSGKAFFTMALVLAIIFAGYAILKMALPLLMIIAMMFVMGIGTLKDKLFSAVENYLCQSIREIIPLMLILLSVGSLIGTWIEAGTVPTLIYAGLKLLSAKYFLVSVVFLCMITSLATGTSWGTVATMGLAMMGVGSALDMPPAITAGAIISGAYFGDKLSPLSDSTNLAPALAGTDLVSHIRRTLWTTLPAIIMTLLAFLIIGLINVPQATASPESINLINGIMDGLKSHFNISWLSMLPIAVIVSLLVGKWPAYIAIMAGALAGGILAIPLQGASNIEVVDTLYNGYHIQSGVEELDRLLNRGGMSTMYPLAMLFLSAAGLGGALSGSGVINGILAMITKLFNSRRKIMLSSIPVVFVSLMIGASFSFSAVMTCTIMKPLFDKFGMDRQNLSRTLEDIGTVNDPTIPWSAGGVYVSGILGVATLDYVPFMYFALFSALMSVIYAATGFTVTASNRKSIRDTLSVETYN